jgi:DNA-binding MarR family transcriptional regulator
MKNAVKTTNLINRLIAVDADMSVTKFAVLLEVYNAGQTTPTKLADSLLLSLATASRHVAYWSSWTRQRRKGQGAVEYTEDPMDRRLRYVSCTTAGKQLIESIIKEVD